jgi:uncharacterized protein YbcI
VTGFAFRYRIGGGTPTVGSFPFVNADPLAEGDMLSLTGGEVELGLSGHLLLGAAAEARNGDGSMTALRAYTDADAVYAVSDASARHKDGTVDLTGASGSQGVADGPNGDFTVVADCAGGEATLVRISVGRHAGDVLTGGQLNAALARAVVQIHRRYIGRGPTKAQAFFRGNVVVVVLREVMTKAEQSLAQRGEAQAVLDTRRRFQEAMHADLQEAVERLTGRRVIAFMSDNSVEPDMAAEVFVLDRPIDDGRRFGQAG